MFTDDITYPSASISALNLLYSATIDGDGYTLYGSGKRGSNNTSIALNQTGTELIDVKLVNLTIENGSTAGRPVEARGNIRSLSIDNCDIRCTGASGYMQAITIGGNQSTSAKLTIKNSKVYSPVYYGLITFNPVDLLIEGSEFECWSALYLKSPDGSFGSRTSKVTIDGSKLVCHNNNSGYSNDFGAIVFEDGTIDVLVKNSSIDVTENGTASQSAVVFSSGCAEVYGTILREVNVTFENVTIKGTINDENIQYDDTNVVMIQTGATTNDPTAYLADGSYVTTDGLFYQIKNVKTVNN